jgi:hypothetical protein
MTLGSEAGENMKTVLQSFIALSLVMGFTAVSFTPRAVNVRSESKMQDRPTGCEYNTAILDSLAQKTQLDQLIIVIAHLGSNETKPNLNNCRLHNVRTYLTEFLTDPSVRRKPETIVLAQGERVPGLGRIEFYVNGRLVDVLKIRTNADLSVANCGREPPENPCPHSMRNFYPCKDRYPR